MVKSAAATIVGSMILGSFALSQGSEFDRASLASRNDKFFDPKTVIKSGNLRNRNRKLGLSLNSDGLRITGKDSDGLNIDLGTDGKLDITTGNGESVKLDTENGLAVSTPNGESVKLDEENGLDISTPNSESVKLDEENGLAVSTPGGTEVKIPTPGSKKPEKSRKQTKKSKESKTTTPTTSTKEKSEKTIPISEEVQSIEDENNDERRRRLDQRDIDIDEAEYYDIDVPFFQMRLPKAQTRTVYTDRDGFVYYKRKNGVRVYLEDEEYDLIQDYENYEDSLYDNNYDYDDDYLDYPFDNNDGDTLNSYPRKSKGKIKGSGFSVKWNEKGNRIKNSKSRKQKNANKKDETSYPTYREADDVEKDITTEDDLTSSSISVPGIVDINIDENGVKVNTSPIAGGVDLDLPTTTQELEIEEVEESAATVDEEEQGMDLEERTTEDEVLIEASEEEEEVKTTPVTRKLATTEKTTTEKDASRKQKGKGTKSDIKSGNNIEAVEEENNSGTHITIPGIVDITVDGSGVNVNTSPIAGGLDLDIPAEVEEEDGGDIPAEEEDEGDAITITEEEKVEDEEN